MRAMLLKQQKLPLLYDEVAQPEPGSEEVLIEVIACGVCRTDLHILDGELLNPKLPLILGHEIVGRVVGVGDKVSSLKKGQLVGVPWLAKTCNNCEFCKTGRENLCDQAIFTGYTKDGGYADFTCASESSCVAIPDGYDPISAAPLLCAGLIGWRSYKAAGDVKRLGIYGFGGAAHILTQLACVEGKDIYAFTRPGDRKGQQFAESLGAVWAGDSNANPPMVLDAAIIFASDGDLVVRALKSVRKGGTVVCGGIHMSDIPSFPYDLLWGERSIKSIANMTRHDGAEFMAAASKHRVNMSVRCYDLTKANEALSDLRLGHFEGAAVLSVKA